MASMLCVAVLAQVEYVLLAVEEGNLTLVEAARTGWFVSNRVFLDYGGVKLGSPSLFHGLNILY